MSLADWFVHDLPSSMADQSGFVSLSSNGYSMVEGAQIASQELWVAEEEHDTAPFSRTQPGEKAK